MLTSYPSKNDVPNDYDLQSKEGSVDSEATLSVKSTVGLLDADGEDEGRSDDRKLGLADSGGLVDNDGVNDGALAGGELGLTGMDGFPDVD